MKTNSRQYVDVHVLQSVPPSCINRDDTGSPKTAIYGGVTRARVSSQSWKHAMRLMFKDVFPNEKLGLRTKRIVGLVADEIRALGGTQDPENAAKNILKAAGLKIRSTENGTEALFFISVAQAKALAALAVADPATIEDNPSRAAKEKAQQALRQAPGIDIALFGRMVADAPSLNTDACAQVAHSISTHKVSNEYDYFTAVDDIALEDHAGAGHIGAVEFNSATLYRYATVAVHALHMYLGDDTADAIREFVRAFACSMPTGKQNTFANRTLPDAVLVTLRKDQPINLVGAFERPVPASDNGYVGASAKCLVSHAKRIYKDFAGEPELSLVVGEILSDLAQAQPLDAVLSQLTTEVKRRIENGEV
jgi:CRISPR system Cascade subunit CasC